MKKKMFVFLAVLSISASSFCQNVSDYFPVSTGYSWTYTNGAGKSNDIITVTGNAPDNVSKDGTMLYLFESQYQSVTKTLTMYSIKGNKVVVLAIKDNLGRYNEKKAPFPVELAPIGQEWRQDESDNEYYLFKTTKSSIRYDDKYFDDCILVEQRVYINRNLYITNKSYFAKGVGLVYKTLQSPGKEETVYQKLINCNFTDISMANEADNLWQDISIATLFFFRKLGELGLEGVDNGNSGLYNDNQKAVFNALVTIKNNNLANILSMFNSGNVNIDNFLNSPPPDFLIKIMMDRRPIAVATNKTIKIITLSFCMNMLKDKINIADKRLLGGIKEASPLLSNRYQTDRSISNDVETFYTDFMNIYLRYGGK